MIFWLSTQVIVETPFALGLRLFRIAFHVVLGMENRSIRGLLLMKSDFLPKIKTQSVWGSLSVIVRVLCIDMKSPKEVGVEQRYV